MIYVSKASPIYLMLVWLSFTRTGSFDFSIDSSETITLTSLGLTIRSLSVILSVLVFSSSTSEVGWTISGLKVDFNFSSSFALFIACLLKISNGLDISATFVSSMDFVTERIAASPIFLLSLNATSENGLKSSDFPDVATGFVTSVSVSYTHLTLPTKLEV